MDAKRVRLLGLVRNVVGTCCIGILTSSGIHAQSVAVAPEPMGRAELPVQDHERSGARAVLPRISVSVRQAPVQDVLQTIAARAGLRVSYVDEMPKTYLTSLRVHEVPVDEAFRQVLQGTGYVAQIRATRNVLILQQTGTVTSGTVAGKVVHAKTKVPVVGATVMLTGTDLQTITAQDGTFRITVPAGESILAIRAVGFVRQVQRVVVEEQQTVSFEVLLQPSASVLDEVIVTGTVIATERKAIPTPITVITAEEIEKRGITNIEQFFRGEVPGVIAKDMGMDNYSGGAPGIVDTVGSMVTSNIFVRGVSNLSWSPTPLKTYIDGVELLNSAYLGTIDPASIERIEIVTGPQAATIYGSGAIGGVMQIFTKKGTGTDVLEFTGNFRYGVLQNSISDGLTPQHRHIVGFSGGGGAYLTYSGNISYGYTGQWQPALFARTIGASLGATHLRGPVTFSVSGSFSLGSNGASRGSPLARDLGQNGEREVRSFASQFVQRRSTVSSQILTLNSDYRVSESWQHHFTIGRSLNVMNLVPDRPIFETPRDSLYTSVSSTGMRTSMGYNSTFIVPRVSAVTSTLVVGATGSFGDETRVRGTVPNKTSTQFTDPYVTKTLDSKSWGLFANVRFGIFDRLYFTSGLRFEQNPAYGRSHKVDFTPTNGFAYTLEHGDLSLKLLASYGRATRPPQAGQRTAELYPLNGYEISHYERRMKAPFLRPEYSHGPQGGFELYYGNIASLSVNSYKQTVSDLIALIIADSIQAFYFPHGVEYYLLQQRYTNIATIKQYGWESQGMLRLGGVTVRGTYSWSDSRIQASVPGRESEFPVGGSFVTIPTHTGNVIVSYAYGATSVSLSSDYVGKNRGSFSRLANRAGERLRVYQDHYATPTSYWSVKPAYMKSHLNASYRINQSASLTLQMTNVGNRFISDNEYLYPTLGRQTALGVSLRTSR